MLLSEMRRGSGGKGGIGLQMNTPLKILLRFSDSSFTAVWQHGKHALKTIKTPRFSPWYYIVVVSG